MRRIINKRWAALALVLALLLALCGAALAGEPKGNTAIESFAKAKKLLLATVYEGHRLTLYCGCGFNRAKEITERNGYKPLRDNARAKRIEWEHAVPAAFFGRTFAAWTEGHPECVSKKGKPYHGRRCASRVSREYRLIQADLYNLFPAVGEINGLRSDSPYGMIEGEPRRFGTCDMEIEGDKAEPREAVRGDIARAHLYMAWAYPEHVKFSDETKRMLRAWSENDPIDAWEETRAKRIQAIQGNVNPYITKEYSACPVACEYPPQWEQRVQCPKCKKFGTVRAWIMDNGLWVTECSACGYTPTPSVFRGLYGAVGAFVVDLDLEWPRDYFYAPAIDPDGLTAPKHWRGKHPKGGPAIPISKAQLARERDMGQIHGN